MSTDETPRREGLQRRSLLIGAVAGAGVTGIGAASAVGLNEALGVTEDPTAMHN